jgi:unsaturated rhamnogalacturonyl hydrolase
MMFRGVELLSCPTGWAQWYDDAVQRNCAIAWSRGVGWALLGVLDLLEQLDRAQAGTAEDRARLQQIAAAMLDRLTATQEADGNWRSVLDDPLAPTETSTAAFYVAAARHSMTSRFWSAPAGPLAAAEAAVLACIDDDGFATGVSTDILPAWEIEGYRSFGCEPSPWGQGAALRALEVMASPPRLDSE